MTVCSLIKSRLFDFRKFKLNDTYCSIGWYVCIIYVKGDKGTRHITFICKSYFLCYFDKDILIFIYICSVITLFNGSRSVHLERRLSSKVPF